MSDSAEKNPFSARDTLVLHGKSYQYYRLSALEEAGLTKLDLLPFSIRILLESVLRSCDQFTVTPADVKRLAAWTPGAAKGAAGIEIPFKPARVILQDFTGVPAVVDLAAMRDAMKRLGGDPKKINPLIPVDLVIDHSIQTDFSGRPDAAEQNIALEFTRNRPRYELLHWAQKSLDHFRVIPPSVGIIHQVNLEYLASVVLAAETDTGETLLYPDSVVGTDSHTVMIGGLGVLGWGVGGIEAEAVMLGQPYPMLAPEVVGFELTGTLPAGVTATDLVLTVTQRLRAEGVVGKFVEFFGPGAERMSVADRAVLANMAPEYGATIGFFPVDAKTIAFLHETGREAEQIARIEAYCRAQRLFRDADSPQPAYSNIVSLDLASVVPSVAGPKRPQDRVELSAIPAVFEKSLVTPVAERGFALSPTETEKKAEVIFPDGKRETLTHGSVVIASITSCTNTSNPHLMLAAGIVAKKALQRGLTVPPFVKTSFGPGSRVVVEYLEKAELLRPLERLGFHVVGFGCLTCIGNSGPLPEPVATAISANDLCVAAVLSGNRNFEGRVNPLVKANWLASPPLVVAFALAGTTRIDLTREPLGFDSKNKPVMLADLWPTPAELDGLAESVLTPELYAKSYADLFAAEDPWNAIPTTPSELFVWDESSTYIQQPPFLTEMTPTAEVPPPIHNARALLLLGDSVTTDHISPAGAIRADSPAGRFLTEQGVAPADFNSYGSRRGNDRVMTRGTFANIRIRNRLAPGTEGGWTTYFSWHNTTGPVLSVYEAAEKYAENKIPLIVLAGSEYGTGSSRDWAAKGTALLGVRAVIARSFERIHRGNLVGMGVLPLEFLPPSPPNPSASATSGTTSEATLEGDKTGNFGASVELTGGESFGVESLGLDGTELFSIPPLPEDFPPRGTLEVVARRADGTEKRFVVRVRIDTPVELDYYRQGGILPAVLRKML